MAFLSGRRDRMLWELENVTLMTAAVQISDASRRPAGKRGRMLNHEKLLSRENLIRALTKTVRDAELPLACLMVTEDFRGEAMIVPQLEFCGREHIFPTFPGFGITCHVAKAVYIQLGNQIKFPGKAVGLFLKHSTSFHKGRDR